MCGDGCGVGVPVGCQLFPKAPVMMLAQFRSPAGQWGSEKPSKESRSAPVSAGAGGDPAWHTGWDRCCRFPAGRAAFLRPERGEPRLLSLHAKAERGLVRP